MRILVSGAGIAGLSAGLALGGTGHDVTIVERSPHLRVRGSPIDVRGDAIEIAANLGVLDKIQERRVLMTDQVQFVDSSGDVVAELPNSEVSDSEGDIEIPREDLALMMYEALTTSAELVFGDSIEVLHDDGEGVDITFSTGRKGRYDLVVGADGMHSVTRRLVFGPEEDYLSHLGFYVALTQMPRECSTGEKNRFLNYPGHMIGVTHYNDTALGVMNFRSPWITYNYHDRDAQKQIVLNAYRGHPEWRVPEILDAVCNDSELYFDSVSQIHMPTWHQGRVVLVGDAAHCASGLSGRGASLAIIGTWSLARALLKHPDDLDRVYAEYESNQRPYATHAQDSARPGGDLIVPATQEALEARNERLRSLIER